MTPEGKDKLALFIGSLGWVFAAVFIVLFFVMLRPADFRKGYDLGAQEQKAVDIKTSMPYFRQPLQENRWIAGEIVSTDDQSITIDTVTLHLNPLSDGDALRQRLLITENTRIILVSTPVTSEDGNPPLSEEREISLEQVDPLFQLLYQSVDPESIYDQEVEVKEVKLFTYLNEEGEYISVTEGQQLQR